MKNQCIFSFRYYGCGTWAGKLFCVFVAIDFLLFIFLEWLFPVHSIDIAIDFPNSKYQNLCRSVTKK